MALLHVGLLLFSATVAYNTYVCMHDGLEYTYYACDAKIDRMWV